MIDSAVSTNPSRPETSVVARSGSKSITRTKSPSGNLRRRITRVPLALPVPACSSVLKSTGKASGTRRDWTADGERIRLQQHTRKAEVWCGEGLARLSGGAAGIPFFRGDQRDGATMPVARAQQSDRLGQQILDRLDYGALQAGIRQTQSGLQVQIADHPECSGRRSRLAEGQRESGPRLYLAVRTFTNSPASLPRPNSNTGQPCSSFPTT